MTSRRIVLIGAAGVMAIAVATSYARQDTLRVDVRLVNVYATVIDSNGRYVGGLKKEDFRVDEDDKAQVLTHFSQDQDTPVSFGIVFDKSGSMLDKLHIATDAVEHFVKTLHKDDDIFLLAFDSYSYLLQDFTSDRAKLTSALRSIDVGGGTALYDALAAGLEKVRFGGHNKRAILLITDGQDNHSEVTFSDIRQTIRESEMLVYALGISPTSITSNSRPALSSNRPPPAGGRDTVDMGVLKVFGADSGGRAYLISGNMIGGKNSQFERILSQIAEELRNQYTLAYYPAHGDDGQFHSIRVRTRYGYAVRARPGYVSR
jgi:Ca-activated chloride channel family protein